MERQVDFTNRRSLNEPVSPVPQDEDALYRGIHIPLFVSPQAEMDCPTIAQNGDHVAFPSRHPWLAPDTGPDQFELEDKHGFKGLKPYTEWLSTTYDDARVMRWVTIQETAEITHRQKHNHYDGIIFPESDDEWFKAVLLRRAGYVPKQVLVFEEGRAGVENIQPEEIAYLRSTGVVHAQRENEWRINYYIARYIMHNGLSHVYDTEQASRFLETKEKLEGYRLGHEIIRLAAQAVADSVEGFYQSARNDGRISHGLPQSSVRFMMLNFKNRQPDYFRGMRRTIAKLQDAA